MRISIGRLEVKALPAESPRIVPRPPQRRGPEPLALHDYLRGRREGR